MINYVTFDINLLKSEWGYYKRFIHVTNLKKSKSTTLQDVEDRYKCEAKQQGKAASVIHVI